MDAWWFTQANDLTIVGAFEIIVPGIIVKNLLSADENQGKTFLMQSITCASGCKQKVNFRFSRSMLIERLEANCFSVFKLWYRADVTVCQPVFY